MKFSQRLAVNLASGAALGLLVACMAWAAEDAAVKRYKERLAEFERAKADRVFKAQAAYDKASAQLAAYSAGVVRKVRVPTPPNDAVKQWRFPTLKTKGSYVAAAQRETDAADKALVAAKAEAMPLPSLSAVPKIGDIFSGRFNVIQVIDKNTMLVRDYVSEGGAVAVSGKQVIREQVRTYEVWIMLRGISTEGIVDDSGFDPPGILEVTGTESYTTVEGTKKTVFTVRPFDEKRLDGVKKGG